MPNAHQEMTLHEIKVLESGDSFGELALQDESSRTASCFAKGGDCELAYLEKRDFQQIVGDELIKKRELKLNFLGTFQFFQNWSIRELKTFSYAFEERDYCYNDVIQGTD
jgi:hypothetical protein